MKPGVMATEHFARNLLLNLYREGKKSLACFLLPLEREKHLTFAAYFLCLEPPGLPACHPLSQFMEDLVKPSKDFCLYLKNSGKPLRAIPIEKN
ncbi:hypothetical protein D4Z76_09375 [Campylobacter coli]|nr:hypothetical protein D4Z76_09375 [Campylobacter coli]